MIKLLKLLSKKQWLYALICLMFVSINVYLELKIPDYMSNITILVQTAGSKTIDILKDGFYMLLCAFGSLIASFIVGYFASVVSSDASKIIRNNIFNKIMSFSSKEMGSFTPASLITRTTNDVHQVQMLLAMGLQAIIKAPIMATWAIIKISGKNSLWSLATLVSVLLLLIVIAILMLKVFPKFKLVQKLMDKLNLIIRENLLGIRVIRAFNAEKFQQNRFESANYNLKNLQLYNQRTLGLLSPFMSLISSSLALSIYLIGTYLISNANMMNKLTLFSDMVVFSSYAMQILMSFMMLIMIFVIYPRAQVSANRILEVLEVDRSIVEGSLDKGKEIGTIEFKNVSFKYPGAEDYVLKDISFKIEKGEMVAFIGSTGSGKSTLINLVPRFYDATMGEVLVNGINIKEYKEEYLNNIIGFIPQKPVMLNGSVKYNVCYGKDKKKVDLDRLEKVLNIACSKEFVMKLPNGYDEIISRGGTNLSGGQKQRIAIARAIYKEPEILIFDDSFSALDYKTDYTLRSNLEKHIKDTTKLIVAQRIGTIKNADKIFVLDEGKIVGSGTHKELLKNCQIYKEIALSQLKEEEL